MMTATAWFRTILAEDTT